MIFGRNPQILNGISVSDTPIFGERPYPRQFHPVGFPRFCPLLAQNLPHPVPHATQTTTHLLSQVSYRHIYPPDYINHKFPSNTPINIPRHIIYRIYNKPIYHILLPSLSPHKSHKIYYPTVSNKYYTPSSI